ncbi:hypothetical protein ACXET9_16040 [Brachybacterium sp. DNPG3]
MAARKPSTKTRAWRLFDRIVADAAPEGEHTTPWYIEDGKLRYAPDFATLRTLLGVPLYLEATTTSGVPALALDVWLSYELRRAGFDPDSTWPRSTHPRILPRQIPALLDGFSKKERAYAEKKLTAKTAVKGVTSASANILGKNYLKQVDVIMTDWQTGPELLISTKRMDSSYGKNAANRVEEAYGDAKNLRLRHPLAAHGFLMGLRSDILEDSSGTADWLMDLMAKLGQEDDAYHATCVVLMDYDKTIAPPEDDGESERDTIAGTVNADEDDDSDPDEAVPTDEVEGILRGLPEVKILEDAVPAELKPSRFLQIIVNHVLDITPITLHTEARRRRKAAGVEPDVGALGAAREEPGNG